MATTTYMGIRKPTEWNRDFITEVENSWADVDAWLQATREDAGLFLIGSGDPWVYDGMANTLSWGTPFILGSVDGGGGIVVMPGTVPLVGGNYVVCIDIPSRPISGTVTGTVVTREALPRNRNSIVIGIVTSGAFMSRWSGGGGGSFPSALGDVWCDSLNGNDGTADGSPSKPFQNFAAAYTFAKASTPGGNPLAIDNRATVRLVDGLFRLAADFDLDGEYVDIGGTPAKTAWRIWKGNCVVVSKGTSIIHANEHVLKLACNDARYDSLVFRQTAVTSPYAACMTQGDVRAAEVIFSSCAFDVDSASVNPVSAFLLDTVHGKQLKAQFEDCVAGEGFLYGGRFNGTAKRCGTGPYSFAAYDFSSPLPHLDSAKFEGRAEDCLGGDHSFGSICNEPGVVTFASCGGTLLRCAAGDYSYGCADGTTGDVQGLFSARARDCDGGMCSFGYSASSNGNFMGETERCLAGERSFGFSDYIGGTSGQWGYFNGTARYCLAGDWSFGANSNQPDHCGFDGYADHCEVDGRGFGVVGSFVGTAKKCSAKYAAFGCGYSSVTEGLIEDCVVEELGSLHSVPAFGNVKLLRSRFKLSSGQTGPAFLVWSGNVRAYDCDLYGDAMTVAIEGPAPVNAAIAHCRANAGLGVNITNVIAAPNNVFDAAYTF